MKLFNSCFLCLNAKENLNCMICASCHRYIEQYQFYACPRCSKSDCSGCFRLSEFKRIFCLYTYNNFFSKIIVNAKDKFNINFQIMFKELFYQPLKLMLQDVLHQQRYNFILLSPYKKERIFHGYWHPNMFFESVLKELKAEAHIPFEVLTTHYQSTKNRDLLSTKLKKAYTNQNILLCDDVLTSGKSARQSYHALKKYFLNSSWDFLTLFRSPQNKYS